MPSEPGIKISLLSDSKPVKKFIVQTANYLLAEQAARAELVKQSIDPSDYPNALMADVEIIKPMG